ncbi:FCD domain-containing protein [Spongiactinospora sp. TRM90649]|uniref:FadR/GntR family transcriptional regulator n=1 Tax=Spongiactinospora sp. TRM90649 TaxID=3031114 RepID=UPI0023FA4181|nr:FCD domain-containing protein [Spongiactinospora sp. TRM90649]MDF5752237.1 FCD domain-containing protein [Spongiactinospora sp. TRM90649]
MRQLRQPRLAEIVAAKLRDDILSGRLTEGDSLPRQEHLFTEFRVSLPAVREAMRILETEGLVSVRRGNVGGAVVHLPTPQRIARTISMVLQTRQTTMADVSGALLHLEPACVALCAARPDRAETTVPQLRRVIEEQQDTFDDPEQFPIGARRFHETIVETCGNETMIVIIGSLEMIWTAHESTVWSEVDEQAEPDSPMARKSLRAALRDHEKIVDAIEAGDGARAVRLASAHLAATRRSSLGSTSGAIVDTDLLDNMDYGGAPS